MKNNHNPLLMVAPLFLVLFIDGMGLGLLFPILNGIIVDPASTFLPAGVSALSREFLYGLTVGIFMICWFFGAAILGDLSDTVGRRKSLLVCLLGATLGYFLSAIAVIVHSLTLLFLGRIIAGFTAGSQPIAQAAIVDVSTPENKARNIGLILLAVSLGFVFGPIIGGILSDSHIVSWFSYSTPLYFATIISFLNAGLLWLFFKETFQQTGPVRFRINKAFTIFISAFQHKSVWKLSVVLLVFQIGWSAFFSFIPMFLFYQYHFTTLMNSFYLTVLGLGFSLGCGYIVNFCAKRYRLKNTVMVGLFLGSIVTLLTSIYDSQWVIWGGAFLFGVFLSVAYSTLLAIFSNQVSEKEQGWIMGVTGSVMALCFGVTSIFVGLIASISALIPMIIATLGLAASSIMLYFVDVL